MSHDICKFKTVSKKVKEVNIAKADNCTFDKGDIQIWIVASSLRNCATFALLQEFPLPRCAFPSQQEAEITHFFDPCFIKMQKLTQAFGALIQGTRTPTRRTSAAAGACCSSSGTSPPSPRACSPSASSPRPSRAGWAPSAPPTSSS